MAVSTAVTHVVGIAVATSWCRQGWVGGLLGNRGVSVTVAVGKSWDVVVVAVRQSRIASIGEGGGGSVCAVGHGCRGVKWHLQRRFQVTGTDVGQSGEQDGELELL